MTIYIDLVLILNFIIDLFLLISLDLLLKRRCKFKSIIFASIIGSLSTLLLFVINNNYLLTLYKLLISIIMILTSFKYVSFKYFKDNLFWLYIISIILGGSIYLINDGISLSNKGLIFSKNNYGINFILLIIWGLFVIIKYIKREKNYHNTYSNYYDVSIYYNDVLLKGIGFLDTGNKLIDPYFKRPIILVNNDLIGNVKTFLVPYDTANHHDLLKVFKPKKIVVNNHTIRNVLIGLSDVNVDGIKIILNMEAI